MPQPSIRLTRPSISDMIRACHKAGVPRAKIIIGLSEYYGVSQEIIIQLYPLALKAKSRQKL